MKKYILLFLILILATVLRVWNITSSPSGLNADEAALSYNAYSLMLTGRDEHGHPWPVNLESFGDFKPAGYAYILIPFIKVFGLTEFAVRLPSIILSTCVLEFTYWFENLRVNTIHYFPPYLSISLGISIFPRSLEVNVSTTLMVLGMWLLVKWLKNPKPIISNL